MKSSHYITQHRHTRTGKAGRRASERARARTHSCTDNRLAAANPEIKASVTDVISGCICGREKESRTNACGAAKVHRKMLPSGGKGRETQRRERETERKKKPSQRERNGVHHLVGAWSLDGQSPKRS